MQRNRSAVIFFFLLATVSAPVSLAQNPQGDKIALGSKTAKGGFNNETEVMAKFNNWRTDNEAKVWLAFMGYTFNEIESVLAAKPHGEKADVQVNVKTKRAETAEGISIKLVSSPNGFNQVDKRWLATYAKMWKMPPDVVEAMKLFLGEVKQNKPSRDRERMFIDEFDTATQKKILDFFSVNKAAIVSDLFQGDGLYRANWMMVALKSEVKPRWVLRSSDYAIKFFGDGPVVITRNGNLKIGRITMQRKGGDGGRDTAKMLQFKINPVLLFEEK
ncbi:MAG: type II restriction endonuclease [Saprospiraceae bacterium]|nr:type II restriction endonuclease [Pyrinomonadaceae bacterium]